MRVAVLLPAPLFVWGGGEKMADELVHYLNVYGHSAKCYYTIYSGHRARHYIRGNMCSNSLVMDDADMVIPLLPIDAGVNHGNVVPWLISQAKGFYERFNMPRQGMAVIGSEGQVLRELTMMNDTSSLQKLSRVYTISPRVKELLLEYNKIEAEVLVLPIEKDGGFFCKEYGDFVLYHSRLFPEKRQHLAIEAMRYTKTPVKMIIAGADNHSNYVSELCDSIEKYNLADKVELIIGHFSNDDKIKWLSTCLGGFYLVEDEDYWAITTTELMLSKKPVIAPIDTGATKYVIKDGETGLQPEGTPQAIAEAIDRLYLDKHEAKKMGEAGFDLINTISPSWETVVETLMGVAVK